MAKASVPVDLFSPGEVFACLGFLEAADTLCRDAEGMFDWNDPDDAKFCLRAKGDKNPFEVVLKFLAESDIGTISPEGVEGPWHSATPDKEFPAPLAVLKKSNGKGLSANRLPVRLQRGENNTSTMLSHWADGSSRNDFKLYSGNRSALYIAAAMLSGKRGRPGKKQTIGDLEAKGLKQLWKEQRDDLIKRPFVVTTPTGGSFNFDPRGAWTAIDAGYSPNDQKHHKVVLSPVVEMLAAWGMENARPDEFQVRQVRYAAWGIALPPILARVALFGGITVAPMKRFRFHLDLSGKEKVVTYAEEETNHDRSTHP